MTTLSTGSILVIIALIEKVFRNPRGLALIVGSIIALLVSLMDSLAMISTLGGLLGNYYKSRTLTPEEILSNETLSKLLEDWKKTAKDANKRHKRSLRWFWIGILFLLIFFARNILQYSLKAFY